MMKMDYRPLLGLIKGAGYTQKAIAGQLGLSASHLSQKLNSRYAFTQAEIISLSEILRIAPESIGTYFFRPAVDEHQPTSLRGN